MKKWLLPVLLSFLFLVPGLCWAQKGGFVFMASTIGPIDSGVVGALEDQFEKDTGIRVRHVGAGTGAALKIAEKGNVDLVMAHARSLEEKFIAEGYGTERIPLMYNDFVILGPAADPAGIRGMKTGAEALKAIAAKQAPFITRGDKSGTHVAEMDDLGKGRDQARRPLVRHLREGRRRKCTHDPICRFERGLCLHGSGDLSRAQEGDQARHPRGEGRGPAELHILIPVNPKKFPRVNHADTMTFVKWLTDPAKGQKTHSGFRQRQIRRPPLLRQLEGVAGRAEENEVRKRGTAEERKKI